MSTFSTLWRRSQAISVAAKEEQERLGHPEIDVAHLFLALLVVGGAGGRALSSLGVTLGSAREASNQVHAAQIALLGVTPPRPEAAASIPDPSIGGFRWSARGADIMRTVDLQHGDVDLLVALLKEPSGHIAQVLRQLGLTEGMVRSAAAGGRGTDAAGGTSAKRWDTRCQFYRICGGAAVVSLGPGVRSAPAAGMGRLLPWLH
ncbi:hypothetical protein OL239_03995 [Arthrobacter sp. ATA002]|uniref:Clp protease N-terminal domain-containing protein n=1 Tax=Arthrobacter sp. ATA002 TaxID=2991715 RepID=UPI0022A6B0DC|nr:Clp protease N-terminal domain-containing protein [Arthrobacter sp. ATA002]WAP52437.1 hypothetical protein OL239_03995 [Arthrobacter sp. ATA002]